MKSLLKQIVSGATLLALPLMLTGCEDILGKWERPTPVVTKLPGSISYETTSVLKGSLDPDFTNTLTVTGDGTVCYSSSDESVATVDAATGKVTSVSSGIATITATVNESGNYSYATKQVFYSIEVQEGYSYRGYDQVDNNWSTVVVPSSKCELITESTTTLDGSKKYIVLGNVNVSHSINFTVSSMIILCDNAQLNIEGRLHGLQLFIYAQSDGDQMGSLNVTSSTGTDNEGIIDFSSGLRIHGGKITATATGTTNKLYGIKADEIYIFGGDIKGQGNDTDNAFGSHGIYVHPNWLKIYGGKVEGIGGKCTATSGNRAGDGICGKYDISGDAIVIGTGGDGNNVLGGYGINNNTVSSSISGRAVVTAQGGNSVNNTGGAGMYLQGGLTMQGSAVVTATGGDNIGSAGSGGAGSNNGTLNLKDQASYTAKSGKSSGNADGQDAMSIYINYYGGTFTAIGGAKGPSGANDGKAISSSKNISNQTAGTITLEYSDDGQTWGGTFDINASTSSTPTYHAIRKTN